MKGRAELVPASSFLPCGIAMRSPLDGISAFERADDLTGGSPASMSCPRQFALLTRVGNDTVPCTSGLLVRRNAPTPTKEIKDMARKTEAQTIAHQPTAPDFLAWHVTNRGDEIFLEQGRSRLEAQGRPRLHDPA